MSTTKTPLLPGHWYHIYNRGINGERLFFEEENYAYFLKLMVRYLVNSVEVYAYCLLSNHFHLLVRVLEELDKPPHLAFSHFFNSYAQSFNKRYNRTGSLFERPFHRKLIESERYRAQLVYYIHWNPLHHGFHEDFRDYLYSSYQSILSTSPTHLKRNEVLDWFGGKEGFVEYHQKELDFEEIKEYIVEK